MMSKFWAWLLLSSEDPEKASLAVKSILTSAIVYVIFFTGLFHYNIGSPDDLKVIIDQVANLVGVVLMLVSGAFSLWGLLRKIFLTLSGKNQVTVMGKML